MLLIIGKDFLHPIKFLAAPQKKSFRKIIWFKKDFFFHLNVNKLTYFFFLKKFKYFRFLCGQKWARKQIYEKQIYTYFVYKHQESHYAC